MTPAVASAPSDEARRHGLLDAALGVFARYGFRKTSMDEVARAAQLSRQGLYLHFATKEALFRATLLYVLDGSLTAATAALGAAEPSVALQARLVGAFDAWVGRFVGLFSAGASDLVEASGALLGPMVAEYDERFLAEVAKCLRGSLVMGAYKRAGLSARQLAELLYATARGLKYRSETREAFVRGMTVAVRALCVPLTAPGAHGGGSR